MIREDLAVLQVQSIISKLSGARKSSSSSNWSSKLTKDLMESEVTDVKKYVKKTEVNLEIEIN